MLEKWPSQFPKSQSDVSLCFVLPEQEAKTKKNYIFYNLRRSNYQVNFFFCLENATQPQEFALNAGLLYDDFCPNKQSFSLSMNHIKCHRRVKMPSQFLQMSCFVWPKVQNLKIFSLQWQKEKQYKRIVTFVRVNEAHFCPFWASSSSSIISSALWLNADAPQPSDSI